MSNKPTYEELENKIISLEAIIDENESLSKELKKCHQEGEKYQQLLNNSNDAIFIADVETGLVFEANKKAEELIGYQIKDIIGLHQTQLHPKEEIERYKDIFLDHVMKGRGDVYIDTYVCHKEGHHIPVEINSHVITVDGRKYMMGFFRDITERKKNEDMRIRLANLESLGYLAGGIAHDFNNFLAGILGNISLALLTKDHKKHDLFLHNAEDACLSAKELTQQILTFSKGGAPIKEPFDLASFLTRSSALALQGSSIKSHYDIFDDVWPIAGDKAQINQVITNITLNAIDAMPDGGVLTYRLENYMLDNDMHIPLEKGKYVRLTVIDQGNGISNENVLNIFNPYFSTKDSGSGLGLYTAFSIISKHGGYIDVSSRVDGPCHGTSFQIYLPAADDLMAHTCDLIESVPYRILIMDDEPFVRDMCCDLLEYLGHDVEKTQDGIEAFEKYRAEKEAGNPFDLVITDLTVPGGIGGLELCKKLQKYDRDAIILASSGYSTDAIIQNPREYGFKGSIAKPYKVDDLIKLIHNLKV